MSRSRYPVQPLHGPTGAAIPPGWTIIEDEHGNLWYVKEPRHEA